MSAVTTSCECRTVSGNRSLGVDLVIGKLMVEENLYDKTRKKSSSLPCSQAKVNRIQVSFDVFFMKNILLESSS